MIMLQDCHTQAELLERARFSEKTAPHELEYNVPASIIMLCDAALSSWRLKHSPEQSVGVLLPAVEQCRSTAEMGMLQLALLNEDINPGSSFIVVAFSNGWRWRSEKGFHKVAG